MIYEKQLGKPSETRRTLRKTLSLFRDGDGSLFVNALHLRPEGGCLVSAEGTVPARALPAGTERIFRTEDGSLYASLSSGEIGRIGGGVFASAGNVAGAKRVLSFYGEDGNYAVYAVAETGVYRLLDGSAVCVSEEAGGTCAAVHYGRLFTASGCRVRFSRALAPDDWTERTQGAGWIDLPSEGGDVLELVPYKEKLYLFRERGITQLRAMGDNLNFKAVTVPYACGKLYARSVANCGGSVIFLTECGAFSFNGGTCRMLSGCGYSLIDLSAGVSAVSAGGKYYAAVALGSGERCVLCIDPYAERGHFIRAEAELLADGGEEGLLFSNGERLYRLTERGLPSALAGRPECLAETNLSLWELSAGNKFADAVTVEGEGYFYLDLTSERGETQSVRGEAGEFLRFPVPVRGNAFSLKLRSFSENVRIRRVALAVREENQYGY